MWSLRWAERERSSSAAAAAAAASAGDEEQPSEMEVLVSVSSDGRVTQWMIRKGFESTDYLKLKRIGGSGPNRAAAAAAAAAAQQQQAGGKAKDKPEPRESKGDGLISRHAGGLCFDFWEQDKSM